MLLVQLKTADVACGNAKLRTSPSSGQATISSRLRHLELSACHSRAAFEGSVRPIGNDSIWRPPLIGPADFARTTLRG